MSSPREIEDHGGPRAVVAANQPGSSTGTPARDTIHPSTDLAMDRHVLQWRATRRRGRDTPWGINRRPIGGDGASLESVLIHIWGMDFDLTKVFLTTGSGEHLVKAPH